MVGVFANEVVFGTGANLISRSKIFSSFKSKMGRGGGLKFDPLALRPYFLDLGGEGLQSGGVGGSTPPTPPAIRPLLISYTCIRACTLLVRTNSLSDFNAGADGETIVKGNIQNRLVIKSKAEWF